VSEKFSSLSSLSVSLNIDTDSLDTAVDSVTDLDEVMEDFTERSEESLEAVEDLTSALEDTEEVVARASSTFRAFADEVSGALSASREDALEGTEQYVAMRDSIASLRNVSSGTFTAISSTALQASGAVTGLANAFASLSSERGLTGIADSSIVAAGRIYDTFESVALLFTRTIPNAFIATGAAVGTLASTMGGLGTVSAAFAGSTAALSIAVGSLASAFASAGTAVLVYSGIVAAARFASSGLSDEAQLYVDRLARVVGASVSAAAAVAVSGRVFSAVSLAIFSSGSASEAFARSLQSLSGEVTRLVPFAARLANILGDIAVGLTLTDAAATRSAAGFAAVAARMAVTSAAIGAVTGGISAYVAGTTVMTGVTAGAAAAIGTLVARLPIYATLAVAAAVATGRVAQELANLARQAQQTADFADRFGQSTQEMEKLQVAAQNTGVAFGAVVRSTQTFQRNLSKVKIDQLGTKEAREAKSAFDRLGISMDTLRNSDPQKVFEEVGEAFKKIEDPAKRTQLAMDIFGRTGPAMLPLLKNLKEMNRDIERLGGVTRELDFQRFTDLNTSFDRLRTAGANLSRSLMLPFVRMQEAFNNASADIRGGLSTLTSAFGTFIADATAPAAVLIEIFGRIVGTILRLAGAVARVVVAFLPVAALAAMAETLGDAFMSVWSVVENFVTAVEGFASAIEGFIRPTIQGFVTLGEYIIVPLNLLTSFLGLGDVFGPVTASVLGASAAFLVLRTSAATYTAVMNIAVVRSVVGAVLTAASWVAAAAAIGAALVAVAVVAIGMYVASVLVAAATTIASCVAMHIAWLFGLGPIGLVVAAVELLIATLAVLWLAGGSIVSFFSGWGEGKSEIDGATASVEELAEAVAEAEKPRESGFKQDMLALAEAAGFTQEEIEAAFNDFSTSLAGGFSVATSEIGEFLGFSEEQVDAFKETIGGAVTSLTDFIGITGGPEIETDGLEEARQAIAGARGAMEDLSIRAAQLGPAGADAAASSAEQFTELQRKLADGKINLEEFNEESARISETLGEALDAIAKGSPEETLKRNLELFKSLDDAAKQAAKSVREIGADVVIGDKVFPRSEEVKARAKEYADEYSAALDEIKKKLASGGFQQEIDAQRAELRRALDAGEITQDTFRQRNAEIDRTSAQEQASIAAEEVQRELNQKQALLKVDLDFADGIRKRLEEAFLSPVDKFQKELDKIRNNIDLTPEEKELAEKDLRKTAREQLIGQSPVEKFNDRQRDLKQGADSGLISIEEMRNEMLKNSDELARALGVPVNPANQMEVAISQLDSALREGKISVEQHSEGLKQARKSFLESLGIGTLAEEADSDRLDALRRQRSAGTISDEEFERGRKSLEKGIIGQSAADKISEQRSRIQSGMANGAIDGARGEAALRSLESSRRSAAGLNDSSADKIQGGIDKINDAFGVAGQTLEEIEESLSPLEFSEYQKAIKKNRESVMASLGIQKSGVEAARELAEELRLAGATAGEMSEAMRKQEEDFMQSLGIQQTPFEKFSSAISKIAEQFNMAGKPLNEVREALKGNAEQLAIFDRAVKKAKESLLESLGVTQSPQVRLRQRLAEIAEAEARRPGDPLRIDAAEAAQARAAAFRQRNEDLGAVDAPNDFAARMGQRAREIDEAFGNPRVAGQPVNRQARDLATANLFEMLPGAEQRSPMETFRRELDKLEAVRGSLTPEQFAANKLNLQAELEDGLKTALDNVGQDRRQVGAADARSREGVDTFFRIIQGRDNPSLKAQLEIARNTRLLAEAANDPDAAPVIANFAAR